MTIINQKKIKYNTDYFCLFFLIKMLPCFFVFFFFVYTFVHTNICTKRDSHVHTVGSVALVAMTVMVDVMYMLIKPRSSNSSRVSDGRTG